MSFSGFMGFVTGILSGLIAVWIGGKRASKQGSVEYDEMNRAVNQVAGQYGFYALSALAFIGWVVDNVMHHLRGEDVEILSTWGIMVFAAIYLALILNIVFYYKHTGAIVDTSQSSQQKISTAVTCIASSVVMFVGINARMRELMIVLLPIGVFALIMGVSLLYSLRKKD